MTDKLRVPDTVYGRHGHWTACANRAIFVCDDGFELRFVFPPGTVARPGPLCDVLSDYEAALDVPAKVEYP